MQVEAYLNSKDSFASLGALLVRSKYGADVVTWELETLWEEIDRETEAPFEDLAKVKLSAFLVMEVNPMCLWEVNTFQNTILAASNSYPIPEMIQEASAVDLAWGMFEIAQYLRVVGSTNKSTKLVWGSDVEGYIAACLRNDGWIIAPGSLSFAQDTLNLINKNIELLSVVKEEWDAVPKEHLSTLDIPATDEVSGQLRRLQEYHVHLSDKHLAFREHKQQLSLG
jgi:hypothetical protein